MTEGKKRAGKRRRSRQRAARRTYLCALVIGLTLAFAQAGFVSSIALYLCLLVPVYAVIHLLVVRLQLSCEQRLSAQTIIKGQTVDYTLRLQNRGLLAAPHVQAHLGDDHGLGLDAQHIQLDMTPHEITSVTLPLCFLYRGVYVFGVRELSAADPFSLMRFRKKEPAPLRVTVYPRLIRLRRFGGAQQQQQQLETRAQQISEEVAAIQDTRTYQYGDSMSRIHWNLTAQKGAMMTKLYEQESDQNLLVLLDLRRIPLDSPYAAEDMVLESCLAVCHFVLCSSVTVRVLFAVGDSIQVLEGRGKDFFDHLYTRLAEVSFTSTRTIAELDRTAGSAPFRVCFSAADPSSQFSFAGRLDYYRVVTKSGQERSQAPAGSALRVIDLFPEDDLATVLEMSS